MNTPREQLLTEQPWITSMGEPYIQAELTKREKASTFSYDTGTFQGEIPVIFWYDNESYSAFVDGKWKTLSLSQIQDEVQILDKKDFETQFPGAINEVEKEREFRMSVKPIMKDILYPENIEKLFLSKIAKYSSEEQKRIKNALELAREKHQGQMRDEGTEYISHCVLVASFLVDAGASADEVIVGLLHDTREDTDITDEEIDIYGKDVSVGTTKLSKKRDGIKIPMEQYLSELQEDERWIKAKGADRLGNIFSLHYCPDEAKRAKYIKETREVLLPIFYRQAPEFARKIDIVLAYVIANPDLTQEELARLEDMRKIASLREQK